ncbi:MAG: dolichol kinase [Ignavibacteriae bacterium]|nr:dolichol kinase [Ignavibacteriota bacterium]
MTGLPNVEESYSAEVIRKSIHLCSLSIPIIYYYITKSTALTILIPLTLLFALTDISRHLHSSIGEFYHKYFGWLLRAHERNQDARRLNGATYVLLSASLCVWLFPKVIVISAFAILIVSDTVAALIGRKYGKHPFLDKSLEGTAAFFVSAMIVVGIAPKVSDLPMEYLIGFVGALLGALVEAKSVAIDDNLSIPLSIGGVMWLLYGILLPAVDVFALDKLV